MSATVVRREQAPRFEVEGTIVHALASPSRGSASIATWRLTLAVGARSPLHSLDGDELFHCLAGEADFEVEGKRLRLRPGDAVTVAANSQFRFEVVGAEPFEALACVPAGTRGRIEQGEPFLPPWSL